eukprot:11163365-Lingulodinium_polyedra.AAC.1
MGGFAASPPHPRRPNAAVNRPLADLQRIHRSVQRPGRMREHGAARPTIDEPCRGRPPRHRAAPA